MFTLKVILPNKNAALDGCAASELYVMRKFMHPIKKYFKGYEFQPPATNQKIKSIEKKLGVSFPKMLTQMYLSFNGFIGPGESSYLWDLDGMKEINETMWNEYPKKLKLTSFLFFGSSTCDYKWAFRLPAKSVIYEYHIHLEKPRHVGKDILTIYLKDKKSFDEIILS